ncbi:SRPBCC domain-containing protein [Streptomyces sp. NPDC008196]|uniref:SRPBCC domain-containing protein n=1 Tax=Streptomyces sp. NPDC008196 TaxID=3364819 RepID=UPI0036E271EA
MIPNTIERAVLVNASRELVWSVLSEPAFLGRWFGNGEPVKIDLRPGGLLVFDHGIHGVIPARIQTVEPPNILSWRWPQGAAGEESDNSNATLVEFTLTENDSTGGTQLTMVESGFAHLGLPADEVPDRQRANSRNWPDKLDQLRADCEQTTA